MASVLYLSEPVRECLYRARNRDAMATIYEFRGDTENATGCRSTAQGYREMALTTSRNPRMPFPGDTE